MSDDTKDDEQAQLTCESCRFLAMDRYHELMCMVAPPHWCGDGVLRDGAPTSLSRPACANHPGTRGNSVSDQFVELLRSMVVMQAAGLQDAHNMSEFVQEKFDPGPGWTK